MGKQTDSDAVRKTQYTKGHEDAEKEFLLLLAIYIDVFPKAPSYSTLARFGDVESMGTAIGGELKRLAETIKKQSKSAIETAA
jgi:hypothetical protein